MHAICKIIYDSSNGRTRWMRVAAAANIQAE